MDLVAPDAALSFAMTIDEPGQPAEARRRAANLAQSLGFDESWTGQVALLVTEVANNLLNHAQGGELLLRALPGPSPSLEVLSLDRGPGMADLAGCLADGYSTAGGPGNGLGAIARLAQVFDVHTVPGQGTALLARLGPPAAPGTEPCPIELGVVNRPYPGEWECGDAWALREQGQRAWVLVVDGLGHGPVAAEAAAEAVEGFQQHPLRDGPTAIITALHSRLRPTRGAALAVVELDPGGESLVFAGVGNIAGRIVPREGDRTASLLSHNGIVGHEMRRCQDVPADWPRGSTLVLHSDGLGTRWQASAYPGLTHCHPSVIAGVLYRDFRRERDDVTVLAIRGGDGPR